MPEIVINDNTVEHEANKENVLSSSYTTTSNSITTKLVKEEKVKLAEEENKNEAKSTLFIVFIIASLITVILGTGQTIFQKWQNLQIVAPCDGCDPDYYQGPWWQTEMMYLGESLSLIMYLCGRWWRSRGHTLGPLEVPHREVSLLKPKCKIWWWIIPTLCDMCSSVMLNYAGIFTRASTVQVLRNFMTVIQCFVYVFYLRRPLRNSEWIGACVLTVGLILTAMYDITHPEDESNFDASKSWLGVVLSLLATIFQAFQLVFEERLCRKYLISPIKAVGLEGCFGLVICGVFLIICNFAGIEDVRAGLYQIGHSTILIVGNVMYVICVLGFNAGGLTVSKVGSSVARGVLFSARSVVVWVVELCIGWNTFNGLSCAGMCVCVLAIVIFYRMIPMPCWPKVNKYLAAPFGCWGFTFYYNVDGVLKIEDAEETKSMEDLHEAIIAKKFSSSLSSSSSRKAAIADVDV